MTEPGEPMEFAKVVDDLRYYAWCRLRDKDPDDQQVAREYDEWWEENFPPGEEDRW